MAIINAIQSVLSIIAIISVGYYISRKHWIDEDTPKLFAKLVTNVSLPALIIYTFLSSFDHQMLLQTAGSLIVPFVSILICFGLSIGLSRLFVPEERRRSFQVMFTVSNTIFIGLPVNLSLFGEKSIPFALIYYIANTSFFWTLGVLILRREGGAATAPLFSKDTLNLICTPPLISFVVGLALVALNIQLPMFAVTTLKYLGNLTTPLSLLFIGITFKEIKLSQIKPSVDMFLLMGGRFILSPLLVFVLAQGLAIPTLMRNVFIIQSAMPIMAQTAVVAKECDANYEYVTVMVTLSTILGLIMIPLYFFFL